MANSRSKLRNIQATAGGNKFDSKKEAQRWVALKKLEDAGEITDLRRQVTFLLIPSQNKGGFKERPCKYIADFVYRGKDGDTVVEDVKGLKKGTAYQLYVIKRKLMLERYGIHIVEV